MTRLADTDRAHTPLGMRSAFEGVARWPWMAGAMGTDDACSTSTNRSHHNSQRVVEKVGRSITNSETPHTALGIRACLAGQRVQFATATQWVARLGEAKRQGQLEAELRRLSFIPLIVVDEVGYIPFDPEAANLMFSLVSNRYERASMIVTSNKPFSAWGEIFGDDMAATAMIDRLIHHAEILITKGTQAHIA
jgi:hypothetical protein